MDLGLAARRQKKQISLEQISESTKIGVRALQAIEDGDFKKLPGGIYSTSYIRQYARAIDFDEAEILARYYAAMGISSDPEGYSQPEENNTNFVGRFLHSFQ
jgi:cytoskeletal protein RodZ